MSTILHLGNVDASSVIYVPFATYDSNGASVTMSGFALADLVVYKNGSVTQRTSTAGFTLLDTDGIDFDGVTGLHGFSIDLADNTDAGFWAAGSFYWVTVSTITVSAQTVTFIACTFRIGPAAANVTQYGGTAGTFAAGRPEVNMTHIAGSAVNTSSAQLGVNVVNAAGTAWGSGAITAAAIATGAIDADALAADAGTEIGTAVWATATRSLTVLDEDTTTLDLDATIRSAVGLAAANLDTQLSAIDDFLDTEVAAIKAKTDQLTFSTANRVDSQVFGMEADTLTSTSLAASAVTEIQSGLSTLTQANVRTAVGLAAANLDTQLAAIQADTDDVQARLPAALVGGRIDASVGAMAANVMTAAATAADYVTELQSGLSTLTAGQVNAEVLDVLTVDTFAEPAQEAPAATASLSGKVGYLFKAWRNKSTSTGSEYNLFSDDGVTVDQKAALSDDATTYTKGEVAAGP